MLLASAIGLWWLADFVLLVGSINIKIERKVSPRIWTEIWAFFVNLCPDPETFLILVIVKQSKFNVAKR